MLLSGIYWRIKWLHYAIEAVFQHYILNFFVGVVLRPAVVGRQNKAAEPILFLIAYDVAFVRTRPPPSTFTKAYDTTPDCPLIHANSRQCFVKEAHDKQSSRLFALFRPLSRSIFDYLNRRRIVSIFISRKLYPPNPNPNRSA